MGTIINQEAFVDAASDLDKYMADSGLSAIEQITILQQVMDAKKQFASMRAFKDLAKDGKFF